MYVIIGNNIILVFFVCEMWFNLHEHSNTLLPSYRKSDICSVLNAEIESKVHLAIHTKKITMNFKSSLCLEGIRAVCL